MHAITVLPDRMCRAKLDLARQLQPKPRMNSLQLFNSLTRRIEPFRPVHPGEARVYSCGPTVYNYPHIGNMRAYVFADVLGRTLSFKGYKLTHIINITDVGHLTGDADDGEDKLEKAAKDRAQSIWDIARHYTEAYWADIRALNIRQPSRWTIATEFVPQMIEFAKGIAAQHCYELPGGLYFDTASVADYGLLARAHTDEGEGRIDPVEGKRNAADFAIWRKTPAGENRAMEWDSPWGKGAPGWHLECSVMSGQLLGFPFDIHTGGIDHREIHHPNEIAQNQAFCGCGSLDVADNSGARVWMHNNFLVERSGKMSKSSGEFLRLQLLIDRGYHPLAYRMMCLQAHYRSELEFSWEGLGAALTRLKRLVLGIERLRATADSEPLGHADMSLGQVDDAISNDLDTGRVLIIAESIAALKGYSSDRLAAVLTIDEILGLNLLTLTRADLRLRPSSATITESEIEATLAARKDARAAKDFARSDALRDELAAAGVEVMDGDPLGWEWRL
jgi:cysteinyl-tRNA synthetase